MKTVDGSSTPVSRREILKTGTLAVAGAALIPAQRARSSPFSMPDGDTKNMHLSLAAYSVRSALEDGEMDLFDFIEWCAELGLAGTELTSYYFREGFDTAYLHELKRHAWRHGLTVSGTAIANDFCLPPGRERQQEIDHVIQWIERAAPLYAPHIRIFAGDIPDGASREEAIGWVAESIQEILEHAEERGVMIGLENHGGITARARDQLAICDAVGDHPWFGINLDTGNFRTNVYEELAMAAPRAVNVQVKVQVQENDGTDVPADLGRVRDILVDANYKGWVTLEYEEENPREEIPKYVERMKELFG